MPRGFQPEIAEGFDAEPDDAAGLRNGAGEVVAIAPRPVALVITAIDCDQFALESALPTRGALLRRARGSR